MSTGAIQGVLRGLLMADFVAEVAEEGSRLRLAPS